MIKIPRFVYNIDELNNKYGEEIEEKYLQGAFASDLALNCLGNKKKYGVILRILDKRGIPRRTKSESKRLMDRKYYDSNFNCRKYTCNYDFFKTWSHDMAYILGFIATDGSIKDTCLSIGLKLEDEEILLKINKTLGSNRPLTYEKRKAEKDSDKYFDVVTLNINSFIIKEDLEKLGIAENKTFILKRFDMIPEEYELDFIRGVFDGDGTFGKCGGERCKNNVQFRARFGSASLEFTQYIKDTLEKYDIFCPEIEIETRGRKNPLYSICYSTKSTAKYYFSVYQNDSLYLKRKKETLDNLIQERIAYENSVPNKNRLKVKIT